MSHPDRDASPKLYPWVPMVPGVRRRTLSVNATVMQVCVEFAPNATTPPHSHVHEQLLYVSAGELILTVDGRDITLRAGEAIAIPSNVPHGARTTAAGATVLDTFTPLREDFLAKDKEAMRSNP
jgi:quercetin dioxygenase-like cupin family protein